MIDPATGDPVIVTPSTRSPEPALDQPTRLAPGRVLAYVVVVGLGLVLGAFIAFVGLLFSGGLPALC